MDRLLDAFVAGLRPLDGTGHSATESGTRALLNGVDALFVVDLEMSGSNAQMHEVMDLGGVRVRFAPGLPEMESWGARVKPRHIGNAEPGAVSRGQSATIRKRGRTPSGSKPPLSISHSSGTER